MNQPAFLSDIRKGYPDIDPDRDYPPLQFKSLKGLVSAAEWEARVDCACAYRLVAHYDMNDMIYNHISVRIPGTEEYLLNPFGMMYEEICASSLIKVDVEGRVLWEPEFPPGLPYKFNPAGFVIHGAIHAARPDVAAIVHTHSLATMAISALDSGLLPLTQTSMRFATVGYHDYEGVVLSFEERDRLLANMADHEVMFLRNHGVLAIGATIAHAFNNTYRIERACRSQLMAQAANANLVVPPEDVVAKTNQAYKPGTRRAYGVLEWPAMRRLADRLDPSYKN